MKFTKFLMLLGICLGSLSFFAVHTPDTDGIIIAALKFEPETTQELQKTTKFNTYNIDREGVLRPAKGFQLVYSKASNLVVLQTTNRRSFTNPPSWDYEEVGLPGGGIAACSCMESGNDCYFDPDEDDNFFNCTGSCDCGIYIWWPTNKDHLEFQTPDGNWNLF